MDYNPRLPDISKIIQKHSHLLHTSPTLQKLFPKGSIIPAHRRTKNLKEMTAPSKFRPAPASDTLGVGNFSKCHRKCDLCMNYTRDTNSIQSIITGRYYTIKQQLYCTTCNVIYLTTCHKCNLQYVGSTSTQFKVRFRNHKSAMVTDKKTCEVAAHFNRTPHNLSDFSFIPFEKILDTYDTERKLLNREIYWTAQLYTLQPHGLNKRQEIHSKKRISYTT